MDIQRLRNLTTGMLHTKVEHVYEDIEYLTNTSGLMTHQIPNAIRAIEPWLRQQVTKLRFWDGKCDTTHIGRFEIQPMTAKEKAEMLERFGAMRSPLTGKNVVCAVVDSEDSTDRISNETERQEPQ